MNKTGFTPLETIGRRQKAMVSLTGFTLLEILVATLIMALVTTGLASIFVASKRHILHARSRMQGGELGRLFLAPLQMDVKQAEWDSGNNDYISSNPLHKRDNEAGTAVTLDRQYTPYYTVGVPPDFPAESQMRKVKVTINWDELTP